MKQFDLSVYLLTHPVDDLLERVRQSIAGGATLIQYRDKIHGDREFLDTGRRVRDIARAASIPFIVNDRIDLALALDADGVHLGQEDTEAGRARALIGPDRILGISAGSVEEARRAVAAGADYLGVGDVFGTATKNKEEPPIGVDGLRDVARAVSVPIVAIGGVTLDNAPLAIRAGASGVSVISAILFAPDSRAATDALVRAVRTALASGECGK